MRRLIMIAMVMVVGLSFTACSYSQSALEYAKEGTKRVDAGYEAKAKMTKYLVEYLEVANKDCGVRIEMVNNLPVTTVKECVRAADVMASVDKVKMVEPQRINDIAQGIGDFMAKSTNLVVPFASIYYGYKNNAVNQEANVAIAKSNNDAQSSMWSSYTSGYKSEVTNTTTDTSVTSTDTSVTNTQTTDVPKMVVDTNSTTIN